MLALRLLVHKIAAKEAELSASDQIEGALFKRRRKRRRHNRLNLQLQLQPKQQRQSHRAKEVEVSREEMECSCRGESQRTEITSHTTTTTTTTTTTNRRNSSVSDNDNRMRNPNETEMNHLEQKQRDDEVEEFEPSECRSRSRCRVCIRGRSSSKRSKRSHHHSTTSNCCCCCCRCSRTCDSAQVVQARVCYCSKKLAQPTKTTATATITLASVIKGSSSSLPPKGLRRFNLAPYYCASSATKPASKSSSSPAASFILLNVLILFPILLYLDSSSRALLCDSRWPSHQAEAAPATVAASTNNFAALTQAIPASISNASGGGNATGGHSNQAHSAVTTQHSPPSSSPPYQQHRRHRQRHHQQQQQQQQVQKQRQDKQERRQQQEFRKVPDQVVNVYEGELFLLGCEVDNQGGPAQWLKDKVTIFRSNGLRVPDVGFPERHVLVGNPENGEHNLEFHNVDINDSGLYECQVHPRTDDGEKPLRAWSNVTVRARPPPTPAPEATTAAANSFGHSSQFFAGNSMGALSLDELAMPATNNKGASQLQPRDIQIQGIKLPSSNLQVAASTSQLAPSAFITAFAAGSTHSTNQQNGSNGSGQHLSVLGIVLGWWPALLFIAGVLFLANVYLIYSLFKRHKSSTKGSDGSSSGEACSSSGAGSTASTC